MAAHLGDLFVAGITQIDLRFVSDVDKVLPVDRVLWRVIRQFAFTPYGFGHLFVSLYFEMAWQRVPRLVRAGKADFQEQRPVAAPALDPANRRVADQDIAVGSTTPRCPYSAIWKE